MNRDGIKKHKAVFDAWLDGETVEYYDATYTDNWITVETPGFYPDLQYRIKPAPAVRYIIDYGTYLGAIAYNTVEDAKANACGKYVGVIQLVEVKD